MLKYIQILLISILLGSCSVQSTLAQVNTKGSKKAQEYFKKADEARVFGKLEEALTFYSKATSVDPNYIDAHLQLANIFQNAYSDYEKAIQHFEKVIALDPSIHQAYFYAAQNYFFTDNYEKANQYATHYKTNVKNVSSKNLFLVNTLLNNIRFSKNAIANPITFNPENLGPAVNSELAEYFPSVTADGEQLYFTVNNPRQRYANEDIYTAKFKQGEWKEREALANINTPETQEGAHSITQDGRYLFFASDRRINNRGRFDIFIAKKVGDEWKSPKNMGATINTPHWESQPIISADSKILFFVRKSSDGYGGSDIYWSKINEQGQFGKPINLGNTINTPGDEQRPYLHPDGKTLYFASNGHPGLGKSDLYKSILQDDGTWSTPENLGYPLNTKDEERGIYVSADGTTGYISSDREGGYGDMDIYRFELTKSIQPETVMRVKGTIKDADTKQALKASLKIIDTENGALIKQTGSDAINGQFMFTLPVGKSYIFQANAENYLPYSENFSLSSSSKSELFLLNAFMQKIAKGKEFVLKNIFFDVGKYALKPTSAAELNTLVAYLKTHTELKIEIGGHTDDTGSDEGNKILSEKRAKAVYDYLVKEGISTTRMTYVGYGESIPLVPNTTEENRAKNRRTAFKII